MLTPEEREMVDDSIFCMNCALKDLFTAFFEELFVVAPAVRPLFSADRLDQADKLHQTLKNLLRAMEQPEQLTGKLYDLGAAHASLNVEDAHYDVLRDVLVSCLSTRVVNWNPEYEAAWIKLLDWVNATMIEGARDQRQSRASA